MESRKAFNILIHDAAAELEEVQQQGVAYFAHGDTVRARAVLDRVEKIQSLIQAINHLKEQWSQIIPDPQPAEVVRPPNIPILRTPPGIKTPQDQYRLPILQALDDMGGRGHTALVINRVGNLMAEVLNDFDHELLSSGREYRWRNTAMWERLDMVKEGLLSDHSPNGIWEITEAGRRTLPKE